MDRRKESVASEYRIVTSLEHFQYNNDQVRISISLKQLLHASCNWYN